MKRSWEFLIPKYYNYGFENFYATVIQRAYRNYKKRPKSLAKRIWEAVRNDGTPDNKKYLGITSCIPYINWEFEKKNQLYVRLANVTYDIIFKIFYQRDYIIIRGSDWTNQVKVATES
ncbi:uncharacterized protein OCT59_024822 [Rhizophagus irregularis]|uniref:uncharacterized protein n=1 Tax=Rhizophagus irregularis TaxID=588596 RepID=UPI0019E68521|nr:hypothetical protein OCT59_024822 [Rhizophagus irregularis]GET57835.1 hypothetical protein GLOIN_2v1781023 [Rhizophagus irregularis DAOM 181602=DAOM 197198]